MKYWKLKYLDTKTRRRAVDSLKRLRTLLGDTMPARTAESTLVLGTWNIRNFDDNRFGNGPRLDETFFYLSEIVSRFDTLAVQEICRDLHPFDNMMSILGYEHDFLLTDLTEGKSGNTERLGFVYHKDKVDFRGVAGEIVLPDNLLISDVTKKLQFARTPFACSFQSGWLKFIFATVHIYYGTASKKSPGYQRRVAEIAKIAEFLAKRAREEDHTYILVGDFNMDRFGDPTADALEKAGFQIVKNRVGSNQTRTKFYDQISFMARKDEMRMSDDEKAHGVLPIFDAVFRDEDFDSYEGDVRQTLNNRLKELRKEETKIKAGKPSASRTKKLKSIQKKIDEVEEIRSKKASRLDYYLKEWRTYQLSDHLPLWVELNVDFTEDYLDRLKKKG